MVVCGWCYNGDMIGPMTVQRTFFSLFLGLWPIICTWMAVIDAPVYGQFARIINVPPDSAPGLIRGSTQLNLFEGGRLPGSFEAGAFEFPDNPDIEVNIFGGTVGNGFTSHAGSNVLVAGGTIGERFLARGSTVNVTGGTIGDFHASTGSTATVSGGNLGDRFRVYEAAVTVSGGAIGRLDVNSGSMVTLVGSEFRRNGVLVEGLENEGDSVAFDVGGEFPLTGTLTDGTPFAIASRDLDLIAAGALTLERALVAPVGPPLITASTDPIPLGIRQQQTLRVDAGGVIPANFSARMGSIISVEQGGAVGRNLEVFGAEMTMSGGTVGEHFDAFSGSLVAISGGTLGDGFEAIAAAGLQLKVVRLATRFVPGVVATCR